MGNSPDTNCYKDFAVEYDRIQEYYENTESELLRFFGNLFNLNGVELNDPNRTLDLETK